MKIIDYLFQTPGSSKTILERKSTPTFDAFIEIDYINTWLIYKI